jgi:hypothetical protein
MVRQQRENLFQIMKERKHQDSSMRRLPGPASSRLSEGEQTPEALHGLFRDWQRTQTQSSVRTHSSLRQQMDVWFCESGDHQPRGNYCIGITDLHGGRLPSVRKTSPSAEADTTNSNPISTETFRRYHVNTVSHASAPTSPPLLSSRMLARIRFLSTFSNFSIRYSEGARRISRMNTS